MKSLPCLVFIGLLVSASIARGADLGSAIDDVKSAIETRLAEIGDPSAKADAKEAKLLGKALGALETFEAADKKGLKLVGKATKLVEKVGATTGLAAAVEALVGELQAFAAEARESAERGKGDLSDLKNVAKVQKLIDKYAKVVDAAPQDRDLGALSKLLAKAILGFEKAVGAAEKLLAKEIAKGGGGGGLSIGADGLISGSDGFTIRDILYSLKIKFMGNTTSAIGKLSDSPGWAPIPVPGGTSFDASTFLPIPDSIPGFDVFFTGTITYVTDRGSLKFTFK